MRELHAYGMRVMAGLYGHETHEQARHALSSIVGRRTDDLDASGMTKATIESLFENFHDGIVAPLMWYVLGGLSGMLAMKCVNTLDSMIGYRWGRYGDFGLGAARLDDGMGYVSARLSYGVILCGGVCGRLWGSVGDFSLLKGLRVGWRDASNHVSVNAGWPEAASAVVLGVRLGGRRVYGTHVVDGAPIGDGRDVLHGDDLTSAMALYRWSCACACGVACLAVFFLC